MIIIAPNSNQITYIFLIILKNKKNRIIISFLCLFIIKIIKLKKIIK